MTDFAIIDYPMPGTEPVQNADCEKLSRMSLPALLYHALVELAQPAESYCLPV